MGFVKRLPVEVVGMSSVTEESELYLRASLVRPDEARVRPFMPAAMFEFRPVKEARPRLLTEPRTVPVEDCQSERLAVWPEKPLRMRAWEEREPALRVVVSWTFSLVVPEVLLVRKMVLEVPVPLVMERLSRYIVLFALTLTP